MKQVFNSSEVAHVWATQNQDAGRNSQDNFYFKQGTIYSYGPHFPIATIEGNDVFFTLDSYSNTTAKHIGRARRAVSHKNIIYCYDVPVKNYDYSKPLKSFPLTDKHENNMSYWAKKIKEVFTEFGNKRIRDIQSRVNSINCHAENLNRYCQYFKLKIKDKELKSILSLINSPEFVEKAKQATAKKDAANEKKMQQATKAYGQYISLWRKFKEDEIRELPDSIKTLCNFYQNNKAAFTRLRFNADQNRLETSKGVQIPADIAKRAFIQLNGCMEGACKINSRSHNELHNYRNNKGIH